jgi:hypothetical protein
VSANSNAQRATGSMASGVATIIDVIPEHFAAKPMKAAGADAVRALFIFLQLLKRDTEPARKLVLGHASDQPVRANGVSDLDVRGIGSPRHRSISGFF